MSRASLTPWFYAGLILFASGILFNLVNTFLTVLANRTARMPMLTMGMLTAGIAVVVAFACFALSGWFQYSTGKMYLDFERLMWGGGHILKFANWSMGSSEGHTSELQPQSTLVCR